MNSLILSGEKPYACIVLMDGRSVGRCEIFWDGITGKGIYVVKII